MSDRANSHADDESIDDLELRRAAMAVESQRLERRRHQLRRSLERVEEKQVRLMYDETNLNYAIRARTTRNEHQPEERR